MIVRQGDVLLRKTKLRAIPQTAVLRPRRDGRVVLALGELTGHAHQITSPYAELYDDRENRKRYLRVSGGVCELRHEEHGAIALAEGIFEVIRQREYQSTVWLDGDTFGYVRD